MKKVVSVILTFVCVFSYFLCGSTLKATAVTDNSALITENYATYKDGEKYSGNQIASHIDVSEFADFTISNHGGTHIDGVGNEVYSNYVIFNVNLNFNPTTKEIGNTGVKVSKDKCDWNDTPFASAGDTEQYIAYGAISATKTDGYGNTFKYEPMFSKGNNSVESLIFNEDGDYTVYVIFETVKNGKYQNHVLSWSFKIRSYIYVVDKESGFPIKESGISSKTAMLDYAGRKNIDINCVLTKPNGDISNIYVTDEDSLNQNGTYNFTVKSNGFVSEVFDFTIDTTDPSSQIFFANLRKQVGDCAYEAEEYFYLTWTENANNPITVSYDYYDYSSETPVTSTYVAGTELNEPGLYHIKAVMKTHTVEYIVQLVEGDSPSQNYEALSGERFNNFKTKWYQVYDDINERFLCFDMSEYDKAYEAAMTIENSSVNSSSGKYYYNGKWYADRIDLTAAMHEEAMRNLAIVYYDPVEYELSEESERTFSINAFDGTMYLNDEFKFVTSHASETQTVIATDENGRIYDNFEFFVAISEQNNQLPHGKYTITETDMYGNTTTYSVYRDKKAPEITIVAVNGESTVNVVNGQKYNFTGAFVIKDFVDDFDNYAILKITKPDKTISYFYQDEYTGIVFEDKGEYIITAYDRNNNMISVTVTIK